VRVPKLRSAVVENKFLAEASKEFLPLPELHDPFTGRKFSPDENPMYDIERAYFLLKDIRKKAWRRAATLRKNSAK
jgi:hypothetical protein